MKFLVTWQIHEGKLHDTLALFSQMSAEQERGLMSGNLKLIGRWHNVAGGNGAAVFETDSAETLLAYSLNWNRYMDLDVTPVTDDEETRALGRELAAN